MLLDCFIKSLDLLLHFRKLCRIRVVFEHGCDARITIRSHHRVYAFLDLCQRLLLLLEILQLLLQIFFRLIQLIAFFHRLVECIGKLILSGCHRLFSALHLGTRIINLLLCIGKLLINAFLDLLVERIDLILIHGYLDTLIKLSGRRNRCHTLKTLKTRHQIVFHIIRDFRSAHSVHIHGCRDNRKHIRIDLHDHRCSDRIAPLSGDLIQTLLNLDHNRIHICILFVLKRYDRVTVVRDRADILNIRRGRHRRFDRRGNFTFHLLRTRSHIRRDNKRILKTHVRQQIRSHLHQRDNTEHDHQYDAD